MSASPVKPLSDLLAQFSSRLAAVENQLGLDGAAAPPAAPAGGGGGGGGGAAVAAYDAFLTANVDPFVAAASAVNPAVEELGEITKRGFTAIRTIIAMASECKKADQSALMPFLGDVQAAMRDCGATQTPEPNHQKAVNEALQAVQWVLMPEPVEYAQETIGASDFWANKIRMQYKNTDGGAPQVAFCTALKALLTGLVAYIKANHAKGLTWNPSGKDVSSFGGAAPAPAPAPKAAAPAAASGGKASGAGGGLADVFAGIKSIDQSSGKTAGLNAVRSDQQTWRKDYAGGAKPAPVRKAPVKKEARPTKPAVCELQRDKWVVEYQNCDNVCNIEIASMKQQVYIFGCIGATIQITGKCKSIVIDSCNKTKVLFDSAMASCELVNCNRMQLQVKGTVPSIAIDKTDGCLTYLSKEAMNETLFTTSKSSEMNVSYPDASGELKETPIPEQFVHKLQPNGKVSSEVSELYSN